MILMLITPSLAVAENYLCITEQTTGFSKINGKYEQTHFKSGKKYIVSTEKKTVFEFGQDKPILTGCRVIISSLDCAGTLFEFAMHTKYLRFMIYNITYGYVWDLLVDETPHIAIGTCSKF